MKRLTSREAGGSAYYPYCFREDACCGDGASQKCNSCQFMSMALEKLAAYEDTGLTPEELIEIDRMFAGKIRELDKYEQAEEKGLLLRLPCKVDDTVYFIYSESKRVGRKKVEENYVDEGVVDQITLGGLMIPNIRVCDAENLWIEFDSSDFGELVFLTRVEAEARLAEMKVQP